MDGSKILIVFYSRTGSTRALARALADELECPVEELIDRRPRSGFSGLLRSAFDAVFARTTPLAKLQHDPADYDLVIIGTPVWSWSMSAAVRTYLTQTRGRFRDVAFFLTHGGTGRQRVFQQMQELAMLQPTAVLGVTEHDVDCAEFLRKARAFAERLRAALHLNEIGAASMFVDASL
jgi:flavodoxin